MKLYIIRHAWAGERGDPRYANDGMRPLTDDGRKRFAAMMKHLAGHALQPSLIATSPLVRCRQTADIVAHHLPDSPKIVERTELQPGSDLEGLVEWSDQQDVPSLAWVGHAPDVGYLAAALIGDATASIRLAKGAVCLIEFEDDIAPGRGELQWLVTAKSLGV